MFKELFTEAWYSKHVKNDLTFFIVLNYQYNDDGDDVFANGEYDIYNSDGPIAYSQNLNIDFDRQGSAQALFDEQQIKDVIENYSYNEKLDSYVEIDKIKYIKKPQSSTRPKDPSHMIVEVAVQTKIDN